MLNTADAAWARALFSGRGLVLAFGDFILFDATQQHNTDAVQFLIEAG